MPCVVCQVEAHTFDELKVKDTQISVINFCVLPLPVLGSHFAYQNAVDTYVLIHFVFTLSVFIEMRDSDLNIPFSCTVFLGFILLYLSHLISRTPFAVIPLRRVIRK